jgi:hypothetical protein
MENIKNKIIIGRRCYTPSNFNIRDVCIPDDINYIMSELMQHHGFTFSFKYDGSNIIATKKNKIICECGATITYYHSIKKHYQTNKHKKLMELKNNCI